MDLVGQTLGQYRILEPIGAGGMATVYKGYQAGLDRYVAVKVLPPQHALTPGFKERFNREARAVAQLSHPNILPIYDFGIRDDISYFVMKYVPDHTLAHLMGQPMDLSKVCHFIDQVAGALDHAHQQGIVHRDVKPSNMLLEGEWLLLADFGLAKIVAGSQVLTATGVTLGTPAYVSPEQAEGQPVDHRSDIYSLGIVIYEMVTGRVPYQGETPAGVIIKHIIEPLPLPRTLNPDLPEVVERVVLKAVAKAPDDRYQKAGALAEALRQAVAEAPPEFQMPLEATAPLPATEPAVDPEAPTALPTSPPTAQPQLPIEPVPAPTTSRWLGGRGMLAAIGFIFLVALVGAALFFANRPSSETPAADLTVAADDGASARRTPSPTIAPGQPDNQPTSQPTNQPTKIQPISPAGPRITVDNAHQVAELDRLGHGTLNAIAVSPDGQTLAVGGSLGIWLYSAKTLEPLGLLEGHTGPVTDIAWASNSARLASAGEDGTVRVWAIPDEAGDAPLMEEQQVLKGHFGMVASVAWSPDGTRLASSGWDGVVRLWDLSSGSERHVLTSHTEAVIDLDWSPDDTLLASAGRDDTVRLWDVQSGREVGMLEQHTAAVTSVAWSPDGTQLASGSEDRTVRLWDPVAQAEQHVLQGHSGYVETVAWSSDGARLASGALDRTLRVWDVATGQEIHVLKNQSKPVRALSWWPQTDRLMSAADDGIVRLWDTDSGKELRNIVGFVETVFSVAWSPDGTQLVSGNEDGTLDVWDAETGVKRHRLKGHDGEVYSVAWSPDGTHLASGGGTLDDQVLVWLLTPGATKDAETWSVLHMLDDHSSAVASVAWSPDGSRLASASWDQTVRVWSATNGAAEHVLADHTDWVFSVAWSPDGTWIASGGRDGSVRIWGANSGEQLQLLKGHTDRVVSVAWSPDGAYLASAGWDKTVRLWDVAQGSEVRTWQSQGSVTSLTWSPDGTQLAAASEFRDNVVRVWEVDTGRELVKLEGHVDYVKSVAWSPDGSRLATGSEDGTVRVWGIPSDR